MAMWKPEGNLHNSDTGNKPFETVHLNNKKE